MQNKHTDIQTRTHTHAHTPHAQTDRQTDTVTPKTLIVYTGEIRDSVCSRAHARTHTHTVGHTFKSVKSDFPEMLIEKKANGIL